MMQLSLPLVICQCAILLVSLERIVCTVLMDFVIDNFASVDIYNNVIVEGDRRTGQFVFRKFLRSSVFGSRRTHVVRIPDILGHTLEQEENCPKIVSFSVRGSSANYNIKFNSKLEAGLFVKLQGLPPHFRLRWARIYSNQRPVIIAYDKFDTGDIGFKLLDNDNYPDIDKRLDQLPYVFMRSDIANEIRTSDPAILYLRNKTYLEDYTIMFRSKDNLETFLQFFPDKVYNERKAAGYYFVPYDRENRDQSE